MACAEKIGSAGKGGEMDREQELMRTIHNLKAENTQLRAALAQANEQIHKIRHAIAEKQRIQTEKARIDGALARQALKQNTP